MPTAPYLSKPLTIARRRLRRQGLPKVRSGCASCKVRHLKCDESRPSCLRCLKRGLPCGGYAPITTIVFDACVNRKERRSYQFFHEKTFDEFTGFYDFYFWKKVIFPASQYEAPIRHALAALGSLHESMGLDDDHGRDRQRDLRAFACSEYNKAIAYLTSKTSPPSQEVAMITCVLFMCFETVAGNSEQVAQLFKRGLHLVEESRYWEKQSGIIREMIVPVIARWRVQLSTYTNHRSPNDTPLPLTLEAKNVESLPTPCDSLQTFNTIMDHVHAYLSPRVGVAPGDPEVPQMILTSLSMLSDWETKFSAFVSTRPEHIANNLRFQRGVLWLRINHLVATILIPTLPFQNEMMFDDYQQTFDEINSLADQSLRIERQMFTAKPPVAGSTAPGETKRSFGLDLGLVPALTYVGVRCRDPVIRRTAIGLLRRCDRYDGLFSSQHCAEKVERFVLLEERGLQSPKSCGDVPKANR